MGANAKMVTSLPAGSLRKVQAPPLRTEAPVAKVSSISCRQMHRPLTGKDGERRRHELADDPRAIGEAAEHRGVFAAAEQRFGAEIDLLPEAREIDEVCTILFAPATAGPGHDPMQIRIVRR
jgi:hypothetical protein